MDRICPVPETQQNTEEARASSVFWFKIMLVKERLNAPLHKKRPKGSGVVVFHRREAHQCLKHLRGGLQLRTMSFFIGRQKPYPASVV